MVCWGPGDAPRIALGDVCGGWDAARGLGVGPRRFGLLVSSGGLVLVTRMPGALRTSGHAGRVPRVQAVAVMGGTRWLQLLGRGTVG